MKYFLIFIILLNACAVRKTTTATRKNNSDNNVVIVKSKNTVHNSTGVARTEFEGRDNLIEINYDSSYYSSKNDSSLTIIKGNRNHFMIDQNKIFSETVNRKDTTIISGDAQLFKIEASGLVDITNNSSRKTMIGKLSSESELKSATFAKPAAGKENFIEIELKNLDEDSVNFISETEEVYVRELDKTIPIKEAFLYYVNEIKKGNAKAYNQIGIYFQLGIGTKVNSLKAEEYFEIAARKGISDAQYNLGLMYESGFWKVDPNKDKAIYYYKLAANQGHVEAKNRLEILTK